jgi:hypothetical protein
VVVYNRTKPINIYLMAGFCWGWRTAALG